MRVTIAVPIKDSGSIILADLDPAPISWVNDA